VVLGSSTRQLLVEPRARLTERPCLEQDASHALDQLEVHEFVWTTHRASQATVAPAEVAHSLRACIVFSGYGMMQCRAIVAGDP
jgi:hypothetical protein